MTRSLWSSRSAGQHLRFIDVTHRFIRMAGERDIALAVTHSHSVRPIRSDWEVKTGLRKVVFEVRVIDNCNRASGVVVFRNCRANMRGSQSQGSAPCSADIPRPDQVGCQCAGSHQDGNRNRSATGIEPQPSVDFDGAQAAGMNTLHTRTFSSDLEFKVSRNDEYERIFELEWLGR
jgi:hypothetical protein